MAFPDETPEAAAPPATPAEGTAVEDRPGGKKRWYVVKVQSGREDTIKEAIERKIKIEGLEEYFGQIVVPVEKVTVIAKGKRVTRTHKLYPGYIFAEVEFNERMLYLFRETSGVGDFVGASGSKAPQPMPDHEVERMLGHTPEKIAQAEPTSKVKFEKGEHVKIKEGTFANMEGDVGEILEAKGLVRVMLKIFGREVPVELEDWQIEHA